MFDYELYPGKTKEKQEFEEINFEKPEITIVTAYYNGHKYIDETINSVLNQTFPCWEWIIVNDGSTNVESIEKLKEIENIDSRIRVVNKENSGLAATRDYGAKLANKNSKYLFFLDDDDLINKTYLECAYWTLQTNKSATWAYTDLVNFGEVKLKWIKKFDSEQEIKDNLLVATALIRKEDFFEVNGYELREKAVNEDWNLWLKFLAKGKYPVRMNFIGFWYRRKVNTESELARSKENRKRALEIIQETSKKIDKKIDAIQYPKQDYNWENIEEKIKENVTYKIKENGKINILMIIPWIVTGGADKFNLELITRINKEKYNVIIVTTQPNVNNWRQEFEEYATVYDLTTFLNKKYWLAFVKSLINQYRIDLIFNTNSFIGYSIIPYLKSEYPEIPIMDYVHMEEWYNRCGGYSRDSSMVASCIDKTLVCNKNSEKVLKEEFGREENEVDTVYIGVDEKKFDPEKYDKEDILKEFEIENVDNKYIMSYICRIDSQKRPMLLTEILKKLNEKRQDVFCVIAGDGPMLSELKEKLRKYNLLKQVKILGNIKETQKIYKISDININCSIKEGLALTSYEAISMGVPVVTSNVGGQAELINSKVGAIVECMQKETEILDFNYKEEEIENYVESIDKILNNIKMYKQECRKRIIESFTVDNMVKNMEEQFNIILKNKNKEKIENGMALRKVQDVCKELIVKSYVTTMNEYEWLCNKVNEEYFKDLPESNVGYDYFSTPAGRFRLFIIKITKKIHMYEFFRDKIRKIRKEN